VGTGIVAMKIQKRGSWALRLGKNELSIVVTEPRRKRDRRLLHSSGENGSLEKEGAGLTNSREEGKLLAQHSGRRIKGVSVMNSKRDASIHPPTGPPEDGTFHT